MTLFRLFIAFLITFIVSYFLIKETSDYSREYSYYAMAILYCSFSWLAFVSTKSYCYAKEASQGKSLKLSIFEHLILPAMLIYLFSIPEIGMGVVSIEYLLPMLMCVIILADRDGKIRYLFWRYRFYEFSNIPDSGIANRRLLINLEWIVIAIAFGVPIIGRFVVGMY